jgi:hypothetical protein
MLNADALVTRAKGDERLSDRIKNGPSGGAAHGASHSRVPNSKTTDEKKGRKQRAGDIGRALRTIYDDTLRESVPDDFSDLLGKLT